MTRRELERLKEARRFVEPGAANWLGLAMLDKVIEDAAAEHATEDRHNDWAELDHSQPNQLAAE